MEVGILLKLVFGKLNYLESNKIPCYKSICLKKQDDGGV